MNKERLMELGVSEEIAEKIAAELGNMVPKARLDEVIRARNEATEALAREQGKLELRLRAEDALKRAGVRSVRLAMPLLDLEGDIDGQITALKEDEETKLLFAAPQVRGVTPGESADAALGIDRETFEQFKHDPDWINRNWAQVADALENGRITN